MKTKTLILLSLLGCSSSQEYIPPPMTAKDPTIWTAPKEDTYLIVQPGWHDGKEYPLTQHLKANPVVKDKLNLNVEHHVSDSKNP